MTAPTPTNIHQRLAAVMRDVSYIRKEAKQGMNYTIVSHDAVTAKVRPVLLQHGIVYYPVRCEYAHNGNRAECAMTVRFVNIDDPADHFDVPTFGYGVDSQDKGPGKAMSYAVKYALLKALGLETGDDPETESVNYSPADPAVTAIAIQTAKENAAACADLNALAAWWKGLNANAPHVAANPTVIAAKDARKAALTPKEQAA